MSALGGGGLQLRKCCVSGCSRLCVKQSDSCRQHTDHPPLSKLFEAPGDSFFDPPASNSPGPTPRTPTHTSSTTPPLHPSTPPTYFHSHPSSPFTHYTSGLGSITGRDTLTADRVVNTADLIPYEIPVDHEDGRPPPHMEFLYDDLDSAREESKESPHAQHLGAAFTPPATPPLARLSSRASPSPSVSVSVSATPSLHPHHLNHHILVVDTRVNDRDRSEEKDHFLASHSPVSRSASASVTGGPPTPSQSSLYMSPRRPSLSPHSPHSPYLPPSTPRSMQALLDRISKLEENNGMLQREAGDLKKELDGKRKDEEGLQRTVRELRERLRDLEEREREKLGGGQRKAPMDLPPVTSSNLLSATAASASSSSSSSSHFTSRLAVVNASAAPSAAFSSGAPSPLSSRGPQLAPLFTTIRAATSQSSPTSAGGHHQPVSPRGHHSAHSYHHVDPMHAPHEKPRSLSHEPLTPSSAHSLHGPPAASHQLASHRTHSPSPSSSPLSSRPASASYSDSTTPVLSPVTSFYAQPGSASVHPKPLRAVGSSAALGGGLRVKASSNGANADGGSMNVGNVLGERPSIRLYPHHAAGDAMRARLSDEGMGIRYEYESQ